MTEEIETVDVIDEFVRDHAVPADDAESFVHLGLDDHFHPTGGYWFPTGETWGDATGWVSKKSDIPAGELVQFPRDDREPVIRGRDELPEWVKNRTISDGLDEEIVTDGGTRPAAEVDFYEGGSFVECPDCEGELRYQNREVVLCSDCEADFSHYYQFDGTNKLFRAPGWELVETVYDPADDQRDPDDEQLVTDGGEQLVYLPSANKSPATTYHRDRDCRYLKRATSVLEKPLDLVNDRCDPCSACTVTTDGGLDQDIEEIGVEAGAGESWSVTAARLREDDGDGWACCLCGTRHPTRGAAAACCSDRFDDLDDGGAGETACDGGEEVVYYAPGNYDVYHQRRDCPYLRRADSVRELLVSTMNGTRDPCGGCADAIDGPDSDGRLVADGGQCTSGTDREKVIRAADGVMHDLEDLAPRHIVRAAPDENEEAAREVARRLEEIYDTLDDLMYDIQRVVSDE